MREYVQISTFVYINLTKVEPTSFRIPGASRDTKVGDKKTQCFPIYPIRYLYIILTNTVRSFCAFKPTSLSIWHVSG